mgnify:CR=1 FL=1
MGAFDDLVPQKGGAFSDLVPAKEAKKDKSIGDWIADTFGPNGNLRGSAIGGAMQGAADLGAGGVQLVANALGMGEGVNKKIAEKEKEYQDARASAGREGFDAARMAGNVAMTLPLGGIGAPAQGASMAARIGTGAAQGGAMAALNPVTNGGENFWSDKGQEVMSGAVGGGVMAPVAGALGRIISPNASKNADIKLLQQEGVGLTPGQALGGAWNSAEQKLTSIPVVGSMIEKARSKGVEDFNKAALNRALKPIGEAAEETGNAGIAAAKEAFSKAYDDVIPKLKLDTTDGGLVGKLANLRGMVQSLPEREAQAFDSVIAREIDGRIAPNGVLSGQNLKDALAAIRDQGKKFSISPDAYQSDLGQAFKQLHKELLDEMMAKNGALGQQLKKVDTGYANFKRAERAASSVGNAGGDFTPAQLFNATKALDRSKDKGAFARGQALMQDLAGAGKRVMGNTVPDSGTAGRMLLSGGAIGGLAAAMSGDASVSPGAVTAAALPVALYNPAVRNALVKAITKRPDMADDVANALRQYLPIAGGSLALGLNQ